MNKYVQVVWGYLAIFSGILLGFRLTIIGLSFVSEWIARPRFVRETDVPAVILILAVVLIALKYKPTSKESLETLGFAVISAGLAALGTTIFSSIIVGIMTG